MLCNDNSCQYVRCLYCVLYTGNGNIDGYYDIVVIMVIKAITIVTVIMAIING